MNLSQGLQSMNPSHQDMIKDFKYYTGQASRYEHQMSWVYNQRQVVACEVERPSEMRHAMSYSCDERSEVAEGMTYYMRHGVPYGRNQDTRPDTRQDTEQDTRQDTQQDTQQDTRQDTRQDTQQDTRQDTEQDTRQDTEQDTPQDTEQDTRQDTEQDTRQDTEQDTRQDTEPDTRQDMLPDTVYDTELLHNINVLNRQVSQEYY